MTMACSLSLLSSRRFNVDTASQYASLLDGVQHQIQQSMLSIFFDMSNEYGTGMLVLCHKNIIKSGMILKVNKKITLLLP